MKKLFLTLALVLMLVVTFVACGDTSGNNTDDAVEGPCRREKEEQPRALRKADYTGYVLGGRQ